MKAFSIAVTFSSAPTSDNLVGLGINRIIATLPRTPITSPTCHLLYLVSLSD